jgi:hypothetical protein
MNAMRQIADCLRGQTVTAWKGVSPVTTHSVVLIPNLVLQSQRANRHGRDERRMPVLELRWDEVDE